MRVPPPDITNRRLGVTYEPEARRPPRDHRPPAPAEPASPFFATRRHADSWFGLDPEPRGDILHRGPSAQGLRNSLRLHFIWPASMPRRMYLHTQRSEKRTRSAHCETHSLPHDRKHFAMDQACRKVGRSRRLPFSVTNRHFVSENGQEMPPGLFPRWFEISGRGRRIPSSQIVRTIEFPRKTISDAFRLTGHMRKAPPEIQGKTAGSGENPPSSGSTRAVYVDNLTAPVS